MIDNNTPLITTDRLILRQFNSKDKDALLALLSDEKVNTYLPWFTVKTLEEAEEFLDTRFLSYYKKPLSFRYAVCLKTDNIPIGYVWLSADDANDFGYALQKNYWRRGIITEAAKAITEKIKNSGIKYITATHDINNSKSGEVMKRLNMKYCYSYVENWQPKNTLVTFRMYQLNFYDNVDIYKKYWDKYEEHFIENIIE